MTDANDLRCHGRNRDARRRVPMPGETAADREAPKPCTCPGPLARRAPFPQHRGCLRDRFRSRCQGCGECGVLRRGMHAALGETSDRASGGTGAASIDPGDSKDPDEDGMAHDGKRTRQRLAGHSYGPDGSSRKQNRSVGTRPKRVRTLEVPGIRKGSVQFSRPEKGWIPVCPQSFHGLSAILAVASGLHGRPSRSNALVRKTRFPVIATISAFCRFPAAHQRQLCARCPGESRLRWRSMVQVRRSGNSRHHQSALSLGLVHLTRQEFSQCTFHGSQGLPT